ncbi:MAG: hypothetical protein KY445_08540 [Armatimonadetes bacterium]|nr:hypothetical protein [Armatimonadota bacterium]
MARALRHDGARYLPGEEQALLDVLSKQQVKDYLAKGHLVEVEPEGVELGGSDAGEVETLRSRIAELEEENLRLKAQPGDSNIEKPLVPRVYAELRKGGFDTVEKIAVASDADLLAVWGVNAENLAQVRALTELPA